jgi:predicted membrane channel-forming protein YqfA (hemolysin III family)
LRRNWGENVIGNGGISLGVAVVAIPLVVLSLLLVFAAMSTRASATIFLSMALFVITMIAVGLVSTTLHTIYTAALYRFATGSKENAGIDGDLLAEAYRPK